MRSHTAGLLVWLCLVAVAAAPTAFGGAWTREPGELYGRWSASRLVADEEYDDDGDVLDFQFDGEFRDDASTLYLEYGWFERLTVFGSLPYKGIDYKNFVEQGDTTGLADVDLGLRLRLLERRAVLSLQGLFKIPGGYDGDDRLPLGNDQVDAELRLLLGHAPGPGRVYYGIEIGYRARAEDPSDEWRWLLEVGGSAGRFEARAKLDAIESAHNASDVRDVFGNPVATLEAELGKLELTAGWRISRRWGAEATYTPTLWGRSTAKSRSYALAAVVRVGRSWIVSQ